MLGKRSTVMAALAALVALAGAAAHAQKPAGPVFTITVPKAQASAPLDGRIILLVSKDLTREPKSHVAPNAPLDSPYLFGSTVDGLAPGAEAVIDDKAFGWPARALSQLPEGDYLVQAVLNKYETFHLADGRTLKLPPAAPLAVMA